MSKNCVVKKTINAKYLYWIYWYKLKIGYNFTAKIVRGSFTINFDNMSWILILV